MDDNWITLHQEDDVISQKSNSQKIDRFSDTFTGLEILANFRDRVSDDEQVLIDGFKCKVLQPGKGWQTGKIRINVEFCPDNPTEPDSPLDEIRKMDS